MGKRYPYSTIWEKDIVAILHIYGYRSIYYYFVFTKTLNLGNIIYILEYISQYQTMKI